MKSQKISLSLEPLTTTVSATNLLIIEIRRQLLFIAGLGKLRPRTIFCVACRSLKQIN